MSGVKPKGRRIRGWPHTADTADYGGDTPRADGGPHGVSAAWKGFRHEIMTADPPECGESDYGIEILPMHAGAGTELLRSLSNSVRAG